MTTTTSVHTPAPRRGAREPGDQIPQDHESETDNKDSSATGPLEKAAYHAGNFLFNRERQAGWLFDIFKDRKPLIVAPYDAELYGRTGGSREADWLNFLIRKTVSDQKTVRLTPMEYLKETLLQSRFLPFELGV